MTILTPTADLVMEVLAARHRLGEQCWHFDTRHTRALNELTAAGLIWWQRGFEPKTALVFLTDAGRASEYLSGTYVAPAALAGAVELMRYIRRIGDVMQEALAGNAEETVARPS